MGRALRGFAGRLRNSSEYIVLVGLVGALVVVGCVGAADAGQGRSSGERERPPPPASRWRLAAAGDVGLAAPARFPLSQRSGDGMVAGTRVGRLRGGSQQSLRIAARGVATYPRVHTPEEDAVVWEALPSLVVAKDGPVQGNVTASARAFRGIPYAQPPRGEARWAPPRVALPWAPQTLTATEDAPGCPQQCTLPDVLCPATTSEDCLYLSVYAPAYAPKVPSGDVGDRQGAAAAVALAPVIVYLHGGSFASGHGGGAVLDGSRLANVTGCVIVTLNSRLGALGYLLTMTPGTALRTEGASGAVGMQDQDMALQWVADNIAAFGGDPSRVTLAGTEAGAIASVLHLITHTEQMQQRSGSDPAPAAPPIMGGIISSEPFGLPLRNVSGAQAMADAFLRYSNCSATHVPEALPCLRELSVAQVLEAQAMAEADIVPDVLGLAQFFQPWGPAVGQDALALQPMAAVRDGRIHRDVPLMVGSTTGEGTLPTYAVFTSNMSALTYATWEMGLFGQPAIAAIDAHYRVPDNEKNDARATWARLLGDATSLCATRNVSMQASTHNDVYLYNFNHSWSFGANHAAWGDKLPYCQASGAVCTFSDVPFAFGGGSAVHSDGEGLFNFTMEEEALSELMMQYWASFADKGRPEAPPSDPAWPKLDNRTHTQTVLLFETPTPRVVDHPLAEPCSFWDELGYEFPLH